MTGHFVSWVFASQSAIKPASSLRRPRNSWIRASIRRSLAAASSRVAWHERLFWRVRRLATSASVNPHGLRALDEPQSVGIALAVAADSTERSWRFRDQSQALVIPNGLNVNAGRRSQARDSVGARHEP